MRKFILLSLVATSLAACMGNDKECAIVGAATGAALAATTNGDVLTGALIGGAGGALANDVLGNGICQ